MPRLSLDTLLRRALPWAIEDRISLFDAYGGEGPQAAEIKDCVAELEAMRGIPHASMSDKQKGLVFSVFIWAEQWHESVAASWNNKGKQAEEALRERRLLAGFRLKAFGKSVLEVGMERAVSVEMGDLLRRLDGKPLAPPPAAG